MVSLFHFHICIMNIFNLITKKCCFRGVFWWAINFKQDSMYFLKNINKYIFRIINFLFSDELAQFSKFSISSLLNVSHYFSRSIYFSSHNIFSNPFCFSEQFFYSWAIFFLNLLPIALPIIFWMGNKIYRKNIHRNWKFIRRLRPHWKIE